MKKFLTLASVAAVAVAAMAFTPASDGPATIFNGTTTVWFDGNGTPVVITDANLQIVTTNNANGNVNVRAFGTLPDGAALPDKAMHFTNTNTGFTCGWGGTVDFKGTTSPSGQFSFHCKAP